MLILAKSVSACPQSCPLFSLLPYRLGHSLFSLGAQTPCRGIEPLSTRKAHGDVEKKVLNFDSVRKSPNARSPTQGFQRFHPPGDGK